MLDYLHQGISLYAMARKTKDKRYTKAAKKVKKQVATWLEKGNINVTHYIPFLDAEEAALEGKPDEATRLYPLAISSAASSGFLHNAALASERFAEYLLHDLKGNDMAGKYFQDSIEYYTAWGSDYKADMLRKDYSHLWAEEIPEDVCVSPDFVIAADNTVQDDSSSRNGDDTPQSTQQRSQAPSIPSAAAHAVGVSADCALITAIAADHGDELVQPLTRISKKVDSSHCQTLKFNTLGLGGDDEPGMGGANEDSASIDISAITTPYTKRRARPLPGLDNDGDKVEEADEGESLATEVDVMDEKTHEVSSSNSSNSQMNSPLCASQRTSLEGYLTGLETDDAESAAFNSECQNYIQSSSFHFPVAILTALFRLLFVIIISFSPMLPKLVRLSPSSWSPKRARSKYQCVSSTKPKKSGKESASLSACCQEASQP